MMLMMKTGALFAFAFTVLVILLGARMPLTPATQLLFDRDYVQQQFPVLERRLVDTEGPHWAVAQPAPPPTPAECAANPGEYRLPAVR